MNLNSAGSQRKPGQKNMTFFSWIKLSIRSGPGSFMKHCSLLAREKSQELKSYAPDRIPAPGLWKLLITSHRSEKKHPFDQGIPARRGIEK